MYFKRGFYLLKAALEFQDGPIVWEYQLDRFIKYFKVWSQETMLKVLTYLAFPFLSVDSLIIKPGLEISYLGLLSLTLEQKQSTYSMWKSPVSMSAKQHTQ